MHAFFQRVCAQVSIYSMVMCSVGLMVRPAAASPILYDPDGAAPTNGTVTVGSLGFDTGNALAHASGIAPGSTFQLFFQTRLSNLTLSPGGGTVIPAGLNGSTAFIEQAGAALRNAKRPLIL